MCGRYAFTSPIDAVRTLFGVESHANLPPRYNLGPRQPVMTIRAGDESGGPLPRHMAPAEWGLVPPWMKNLPTKPMINARIETVDVKPSFRAAYKRRRCLVPANGWYEWRTEAGAKQPYAIVSDDASLGGADGLFAFAGIWEVWHGPDGGDEYQTVAILTASADGPLADIHHRRPVVIMPASYTLWLAPTDPLPQNFLRQIDVAPEEAFRTYPVDRRVGNVRFDHPDCLAPYTPPPSKPPQGELF